MRGTTFGTYAELLYSMPYNGTPLANSTTRTLLSSASSSTTSMPFRIPIAFWDPSRPGGQAFKVVARAFFSTTGTPAFTFAAALDTTQGTYGTTLAATGGFTTPSGASGYLLEADFDCSVQALGTSGSLSVGGKLSVGTAGNAATAAATVYALGTSANVTINTTVDNYLEIWGTWGTASASNTITLAQLLVYGLN